MNRRTTIRAAGVARCVIPILLAVATGVIALPAQTSSDWKAPARAARKTNPVAPTRQSVSSGGTLFAQVCVVCHGATGVGNGPAAVGLTPKPRNLREPRIASQKDGELFWKINTGRAPMPGFGTALKTEQVWHLVNYVRTLSPKPAVDGDDSSTNPAGGEAATSKNSKPDQTPSTKQPAQKQPAPAKKPSAPVNGSQKQARQNEESSGRAGPSQSSGRGSTTQSRQ